MKTIYLIAGHNGKGSGAASRYGDEGEETIQVRNDLAQALRNNSVDVKTDEDRMRLRDVIKWVSRAKKNDLILDIHFNAFNGSAHGTEVFVANEHSYVERSIAEKLCDAICDSLGTFNRGVKPESKTARRRIGILSGKPRHAINVLIEVCFIDNEEDMIKYDNRYWEMIDAMAKVLYDWAWE
jgi:N-acetylmuramoyl-L-alanine amidase